jgi:hypothetical protein
MKLIIIDHEDHSEVSVMDGDRRLNTYVFGDYLQARAFVSGFLCAKSIMNGLVQSLPMTYETKDAR